MPDVPPVLGAGVALNPPGCRCRVLGNQHGATRTGQSGRVFCDTVRAPPAPTARRRRGQRTGVCDLSRRNSNHHRRYACLRLAGFLLSPNHNDQYRLRRRAGGQDEAVAPRAFTLNGDTEAVAHARGWLVLVALDTNVVDLVQAACSEPGSIDSMEAIEPPPRFEGFRPSQEIEVFACYGCWPWRLLGARRYTPSPTCSTMSCAVHSTHPSYSGSPSMCWFGSSRSPSTPGPIPF